MKTKKNKINTKEVGFKRALSTKLSIIGGKAILPISIGLIGLGLMTCSDPAATEETPGLMVSELTTPDESKSYQRQFTVRLNTSPTADVTITISADDANVIFTPATPLGFTSDNWNTQQTVTVTNADFANTDLTITISTSSDDTAYDDLSRELASITLPQAPAYDLHVHDAQTPELEGTTARSVRVWFTIHPTNSLVSKADSDITITYRLGGGDAESTDYTAPSGNTVKLASGTSRINLDIPLVADTPTTMDVADETFTVTIMEATPRGCEDRDYCRQYCHCHHR